GRASISERAATGSGRQLPEDKHSKEGRDDHVTIAAIPVNAPMFMCRIDTSKTLSVVRARRLNRAEIAGASSRTVVSTNKSENFNTRTDTYAKIARNSTRSDVSRGCN